MPLCSKPNVLTLWIIFFLFCHHLPLVWCGPSDRSYWVERYNALSPEDHSLVPKTIAVFNRVLAAADKRESRYPTLIILKNDTELFALSLMDGTILLTQKAMTFCFDSVDERIGAARMAFVLGHEMAHLAKNDFWDVEAYHRVARYGLDKVICNEIQVSLKQGSDLSNSPSGQEVLRKKEYQADAYGLLYAAMAGYDPLVLMEPPGENVNRQGKKGMEKGNQTFFHQWRRISAPGKQFKEEKGFYSADPDKRAAFVEVQIREVADHVVLFQLGVRLFQLGRYKDALEFLTAFRKKFPCREVLSDIGLIHFQLALEALARYDHEAAYRFKLSTVLDSVTRAESFYKGTVRGSEEQPMQIYRHALHESIRHFQAAADKDPFYAPAHVNLSSAYIMDGQYSAAVSEADKALKLKKSDPKALNNRAVALYLMGPSIQVEMFDVALKIFETLIESNPGGSNALYNRAVLLSERQRNAAAKAGWQRFLSVEGEGRFADLARQRLGIDGQAGSSAESGALVKVANLKASGEGIKECLMASPIKLGDMDGKTIAQLKGYKRRMIDIGSIFGEYYTRNGVRVLAIEGVVEMVECPVDDRFHLTEIIEAIGKARQVVTGSVSTIQIHDGFAVECIAGKPENVIFFETTSGGRIEI